MTRIQLSERAEHFSSVKIQLLLNHLRDMPESHRALVIVKQPYTASNLALILQVSDFNDFNNESKGGNCYE